MSVRDSIFPSRLLATATAGCLLGFGGAAQASCDGLAKSAGTVSAEEVSATYAQLVGCDQAMAEEYFDDFMRASKTVEALTSLSLAAVDGNVNAPVWAMLEKVPELSVRDEVAKAVGASCGEHTSVVGFLKGAHGQLRDRQFGMWREAFRSCPSEDLTTWLGEVIAQPPSVSYDEKYNVVTEALVKRQRADSLPTLAKAAVAASKNGGPFTTVLDRMNESVKPDTFGGKVAEDDRKKLEEALVGVARQVAPELAAQVADRLYQAGSEDAAASLLPTIYADRVVGKGTLQYGVASVESCDKEAVIHYAAVVEPAKRWSITDDVLAPARTFKPRLKCTPEGEWPVLTSPEPLVKGGMEAWLEPIEAEWAGKGLDVKLREEKAIELP